MVEKAPEAFRNISEVSSLLGIPAHVLRFWETRFNQIKPIKRSGGRRYYRPDDITLLKRIRSLLYDEGYTIKGAQASLSKRRKSEANTSAGENNGETDAVKAQAARATPENLSEAARLLSQAQGRIDTLLARL